MGRWMKLAAVAVAACAFVAPAAAAPARTLGKTAVKTAERPYLGAIAVESPGGRVLFADSPDIACYPASCTKLMTARLLLKAVSSGKRKLDDRIVQTDVSCREEPSKLDLAPGESVSVRDALAAIMVKSANDIALAIAEDLAGSRESFAAEMNAEAAKLGMTNTVFVSPNGLPPARRDSGRGYDRSTPRDLARLALAIIDEQPELLEYTNMKSVKIPCRGGKILELGNHNKLLWKSDPKTAKIDGLKTGFFSKAGFTIVLTGTRNGKRVVAVVAGSPSWRSRDAEAARILKDALDAIDW